jgi:signal transduction histidine kinase
MDNFVRIKVKDTGVGMDEKQISNLFKLDQTHSTVGTSGERGTGLGLMLCKELVEKQGGKIWIESSINVGTTFYFTLPKAK